MPSYDVTMTVNVASVGARSVTRTIVAATLEDALTAAKQDLVTVATVRVVPTP